MQPTSEKIDVERLQVDIPKWQQWLSNSSQLEWTQFLSELDLIVNQTEDEFSSTYAWYLQELESQDYPLKPAVSSTETNILHNERQDCMVRMFTNDVIVKINSCLQCLKVYKFVHLIYACYV